MVGGALGFVDLPGPPPLSSSGVAQEIAKIYRDMLGQLEEAFAGMIQKNVAEAARTRQTILNGNGSSASGVPQSGLGGEMNQTSMQIDKGNAQSGIPQASPRSAGLLAQPQQMNPLLMSAEQMATYLAPDQIRLIQEKHQHLAELARKVQMHGDPQAQAKLQQSLMQQSQPGIVQPNLAAVGQSGALAGIMASIGGPQIEAAKLRLNQMYAEQEPGRGRSSEFGC
jgi:hypothetical protein